MSGEKGKAPGIVPISDVRSIGEKRNCLGVILYAIEPKGETFTVTTWGKNRPLCKHMADIGKRLADCIFDGTVEPAATEPPDCQHCNGTGIEASHD